MTINPFEAPKLSETDSARPDFGDEQVTIYWNMDSALVESAQSLLNAANIETELLGDTFIGQFYPAIRLRIAKADTYRAFSVLIDHPELFPDSEVRLPASIPQPTSKLT